MLGPDDFVFCSPPRDDVPLLDRLPAVKAAGFAGISLLPGDIFRLEEAGMTGDDIGRRIADAGLVAREVDCIGCWLPSHVSEHPPGEMAGFLRTLTPERVIAAAARVGASSVVVVEMMGTTAPSIDEAAEAFARVCDMAADHGLAAHIEALPCGTVSSVGMAWKIVEAAGRPNGGLTIDSWHLVRGGTTLAELGAIPGDRVMTVQINDGPAAAVGPYLHETMTARRLPGEGDFDLVGLIRTLDAMGSTAPIGVEIFSADLAVQPIAETARDWMASARQIIDRARGTA